MPSPEITELTAPAGVKPAAAPPGAAPAPSPAASAAPALKLYDEVKHVENQIKSFPRRHGTVNVGTYDAKANKFRGYFTPEDTFDSGQDGPGPIHKPTGKKHDPVAIPVDAVTVGLTFRVANVDGPWSVTVNGKTGKAASSKDPVTVDVGTAIDLNWTINAKGHSFDSRGRLVRPSVGAGAFTVAAIPVTIVYAPPGSRSNYALYTATKSVGSTASVSFTDETATTKPTSLPQYDGNSEFKSATGAIAKACSASGNPYLQAVGVIASIASAGMDTVSSTLQTGQKSTKGNSMTLRSTLGSSESAGKGTGDRIHFLKNAKLAWLVQGLGAKGQKLSLTMLGYEAESSPTVEQLKDDLAAIAAARKGRPGGPPPLGPITGLPAEAINSMLALDPFVAHGPGAQLDPRRFTWVTAYDVPPNLADYTLRVDNTQVATESQATADYRVQTDDYSPGFWTALGIGGDPDFEKKTVVTTTSHTSMGEQSKTVSSQAELHLFSGPGEKYSLEVYYDHIFGTFACRTVSGGKARLSGTLADTSGKPLANHPVTLEAGGRRFMTTTDATGQYEFRSPNIPEGTATLVGPSASQAVQIASA